jgi:hypothetical protein
MRMREMTRNSTWHNYRRRRSFRGETPAKESRRVRPPILTASFCAIVQWSKCKKCAISRCNGTDGRQSLPALQINLKTHIERTTALISPYDILTLAPQVICLSCRSARCSIRSVVYILNVHTHANLMLLSPKR